MKEVGVKKVAQALNVSARRVQQLAEEGMPKGERGRYDLAKCTHWYIRFLQDALKRQEPAQDLTETRNRLNAAKADRAELELARARGEIIPIDLFESRMAALIIPVRQQMLVLPARVAPQLEGERRTVIKQRLDLAVKELLRVLSKDGDSGSRIGTDRSGELAGSRSPTAGSVGSATRAANKRVGRTKKAATKGRKRKARAVGN